MEEIKLLLAAAGVEFRVSEEGAILSTNSPIAWEVVPVYQETMKTRVWKRELWNNALRTASPETAFQYLLENALC